MPSTDSSTTLIAIAEPGALDAAPVGQMRKRRISARRLHTWAGLIAGAWLAVLGLTGFVLDHRNWNWLWQSTLSESMVPDNVVAKSRTGTVKLYQVNPDDPMQRIAGGPQGLWVSDDAGDHWFTVVFAGYTGSPGVNSISVDAKQGWQRLWLATDDGVWRLDHALAVATRIALPAQSITALTAGATADDLLGVVDRSRVFRLNVTAADEPEWLTLATPDPSQLPESIDLSRLVHDLHFGRGLFEAPLSLVINDTGAWLMLLLPLGGFLFWWLPKRWHRQTRDQQPPARHKKHTMRWLFRLHGPTLGLISLVPFMYLALTGIVLDHSKELRPWLKATHLTARWQPPVYRLSSWEGQIYAIAGYPGVPDALSLGTRLGLFTSSDRGRSWSRETAGPVAPGFVWSLRRFGEQLLIGGMGGPNLQRSGAGRWLPVSGSGHMPTDVSPDGQGGLVWLNHDGLHQRDGSDAYQLWETRLPQRDGVPWYFVLEGLHSGLLIHPQWKWVNDAVALACLLLMATGLLRWWKTRWL